MKLCIKRVVYFWLYFIELVFVMFV